MAEYWKSAPRFWCKQCKIFIRDTPFEKTQHEASGKHQSNLKRFLREIHKDNERQQKEAQRAKNEVERLRQAVGGASATTAKDSGDAAPGKRSAVSAPTPAERPVSLDERKKQMAQLADMGIAIPQEYRADMALAGEWQTLSETKLQPQNTEESEATAKSIGVRKRRHEGDGDEEDEHAPEGFVSKGWGSKTREYPGAQADEDLDALLASAKDIKKPKRTTSAVEPEELTKEPTFAAPGEEDKDARAVKSEDAQVKGEETIEAPAPPDLTEPLKSEETTPGVIFKKRKPKTMRR